MRQIVTSYKHHYSILSPLCGLFLLTLVNCSAVSQDEINRVQSPDGQVDALLLRYNNGGATTGYVYKLFIVPTGKTPDDEDPNLVVDHIKDLELRWQQAKLLVVQFEHARIFNFSNFWQSKALDNFRYVVELRILPKSESFSLSPEDRWMDIKK